MRQILTWKCFIIFFPVISHHLRSFLWKPIINAPFSCSENQNSSPYNGIMLIYLNNKLKKYSEGWNSHYIQESTQGDGISLHLPLDLSFGVYHQISSGQDLITTLFRNQYPCHWHCSHLFIVWTMPPTEKLKIELT